MRPDASKTVSSGIDTDRPRGRRLCDCGCGESFVPIRHQRFVDDAHRKRAWKAKNSGPLAIAEIKARLVVIEKHLGLKGA